MHNLKRIKSIKKVDVFHYYRERHFGGDGGCQVFLYTGCVTAGFWLVP